MVHVFLHVNALDHAKWILSQQCRSSSHPFQQFPVPVPSDFHALLRSYFHHDNCKEATQLWTVIKSVFSLPPTAEQEQMLLETCHIMLIGYRRCIYSSPKSFSTRDHISHQHILGVCDWMQSHGIIPTFDTLTLIIGPLLVYDEQDCIIAVLEQALKDTQGLNLHYWQQWQREAQQWSVYNKFTTLMYRLNL